MLLDRPSLHVAVENLTHRYGERGAVWAWLRREQGEIFGARLNGGVYAVRIFYPDGFHKKVETPSPGARTRTRSAAGSASYSSPKVPKLTVEENLRDRVTCMGCQRQIT
jgi:hypothetical protein